jgi:hypothetical protein
MPWIIAGGALLGGALSSAAGSSAARRQERAANNATAEQRRQFDLMYGDQAPFRDAGQNAVRELAGLSGYNPTPSAEMVMAEPGYQFGLDQGRNAIQGTAAARGGLYSGNALRELTRYGGDYATTRFNQANDRAQQQFGNRWNRLASLAGLGQTSVQQTGAAGMGLGGAIGNNMMGAANAGAAAGMQRANIWGNAANQLGGYMAWNQSGRSGGGASPYSAPNNWSQYDTAAPDNTGPY